METIWQFKTARFTVSLQCESEQCPDLSWADDETLENLKSGLWENVTFRVAVDLDGQTIGTDYLGNSIYENVADFRDHIGRNVKGHGSYFSDMVRGAVKEARATLAETPRMRA